jgi:predicted Zn-dependent protease
MRATIPFAALLALVSAGAHAQLNPAAKVLLDQANFWYAQNRPNDAQRALDRLLRLEPDNPDALGLLAQIEAEQGDRTKMQTTLAHLRSVRPDDPHIASAEQAIRAGSIDPAGLEEARRLARDGHNAEAIAAYKRLFKGAPPPASLATEYYETLSGTEGGWDAARAGLARIVQASPQDLRSQLAYAQLLTYRDQTRAEGAERLAALSHDSQTAAAATKLWRQSLEWMPIDTSSIPAYQAWLARYPNDGGISGRLEQARNPPLTPLDQAAIKRTAGFSALSAGRVQDAEADFQAVLTQTPEDPDALGGMGLVRLRQGNTGEARTFLSRAMAADPTHKARWEAALRGASVGEDYAAARSMIQRGQLDAAEHQLRAIIASGGDVAGAQMMLADVLGRRGDLPGAEAQYRAVLAHQPNNADALVGMAQILNRQGRGTEAEAMLDRAQTSGNGRAVARIRVDSLRQQAAATNDPTTKEALLRAALGADPADPWTRLDLGRALVAGGKKAEARQVMGEIAGAPNPSLDALRASAIFAAEDGRPADAAALIGRLPAAARTADMRALLAQASRQNDIRSAMSLAAVSPIAAREKLLTLAARPDPDGGNGVAVARAFLEMHDPAGARQALATAQAATPKPTPAQRIAYAGLLLQAGNEPGAQLLIRGLSETGGLTAAQTTALNQLRAGAAIRQSDTLNGQHDQAAAYDALAPALAAEPSNPDLNLALGRLYAGADQPHKALALNLAVLERDPGDLDARRAAVDAAIQVNDWARASALVRDGIAASPDDARTWLMSAALNRARGNLTRTYSDLKRAQGLRRQEIGSDNPPVFGQAAGTASRYTQLADTGALGISPSGNPFRSGAAAASSTSMGDDLSAVTATPADPLLQNIDQQVATTQQDLAPKFTIGPVLRSRTGSGGLDQLDEVSLPTELVSRPFGHGQLTLTTTPDFLSAGTLPKDVASQARFGTGAFGLHPAPTSQQAEGVGLSLAYQIAWMKVDVGSTPYGFQRQNILGGIELSPKISDGVRLRVVGERRAITDSLLSYAGAKDPGTGLSWGGIVRTRAHAQLEFSLHDANIYAGVGYSTLNGENVLTNQEYEFGAGGTYPIWRDKDDELRLGLDVVYFGYKNNTDFFTYGQGGYFSPQSYFATLIPLKYTVKSNDLTWSIGGALGYQTYNEHSSVVFPTNSVFQNALVAEAALVPTPIQTVLPGQSASGLVGIVRGSVEYKLNSSFVLGAQASYQHAGNWSEAIGRMYGRYIFDGATW